jgi:anaerobic selenocysteine-containing dehydrogenase
VYQQEYTYRKYETGGLRADGEPGFETPTGLVELKSTIYPNFGINALPYYEEPVYSPYTQSAEVVAKYPLVLTTGGRNLSMFHSEHRQVPQLRTINPWPKVTINTETAKKYGIADGDWVKIENPIGSCVQKANVNDTVERRVVHAEHGWWFPEQDGEAPNLYGNWKANINLLIPSDVVGVSGYGAPYKNVICSIRKVGSLDD